MFVIRCGVSLPRGAPPPPPHVYRLAGVPWLCLVSRSCSSRLYSFLFRSFLLPSREPDFFLLHLTGVNLGDLPCFSFAGQILSILIADAFTGPLLRLTNSE